MWCGGAGTGGVGELCGFALVLGEEGEGEGEVHV